MIARTLILFSLVLCCTASVFAQEATLEERKGALKDFKRYYRKFKSVPEKVEAVRTLEGMETVAAADELVELLNHKVPDIRNTALDVLSTYRGKETFAAFLEALPEMRNQEQRAMLIQVLGNAGQKAAMPLIHTLVLEDKKASEEVRYRAARVASLIGGADSVPMLEVLLADPGVLVRMAAADSAGALRLKALSPKLMLLIDDDAWQVQAAAVAALGKVREPKAVDPLISLMRKGGRVVEACADALFQITGMDFGLDADAWKTTWDKYQAIPGWRIPNDEELAKKAEARKRYDAIYGNVSKATSFGGIKTTSVRMLFIIDVSGSMEDLIVQKEKFDADYPNYEKLTIVKTELIRTIETLEANVKFNIVAFASDVKSWKNYLAPANGVAKKAAMAWGRRLKPLGGSDAQAMASAGLGGTANLAAGKTNTFKALMYPFGIDPDKNKRVPRDLAIKNKVDTMVSLSDRRPTTGKVVDVREILKQVNQLNEKFRITIHCLAIGEFQRAFLQSLAERNEGTFVDLGY